MTSPFGRQNEVTGPLFVVDEERQELMTLLLEAGQRIPQAQKNAADAVRRRLSVDEASGEPVWTGLNGLTARGLAGRIQLAGQIIERDQLAAFGPLPLETAREQLHARGWTDQEIEDVLRNRLTRTKDGQIEYDGRIGGDWLIPLAVDQAHAALTKLRSREPSEEAVKAHRADAARRGVRYRL